MAANLLLAEHAKTHTALPEMLMTVMLARGRKQLKMRVKFELTFKSRTTDLRVVVKASKI